MRYYYDCEFLEDGRTIELISIGIVADDGREYYAVNADLPLDRIKNHDWLMWNVFPHLPLTPGCEKALAGYLANGTSRYPRPSIAFLDINRKDAVVRPKWVIANEVRDFLLAGEKPELWAWYADYDHVTLCQLWGTMISLPDGIPMWTNDLRQEYHRLGDPARPGQTSTEHHALADARYVRYMHSHLERVEAER